MVQNATCWAVACAVGLAAVAHVSSAGGLTTSAAALACLDRWMGTQTWDVVVVALGYDGERGVHHRGHVSRYLGMHTHADTPTQTLDTGSRVCAHH